MKIRPLVTAAEVCAITCGLLTYRRLDAAKRGESDFGSIPIPLPISTSGRSNWYRLADVLGFMNDCGCPLTPEQAAEICDERRKPQKKRLNRKATNSTVQPTN